jgi:hypothetical protein
MNLKHIVLQEKLACWPLEEVHEGMPKFADLASTEIHEMKLGLQKALSLTHFHFNNFKKCPYPSGLGCLSQRTALYIY